MNNRFYSSFICILFIDQLQKTLIPEQRGVTEEDAGHKGSVQPQLFPENNHRVPSVQADLSVPALRDTVTMQVQTRSNQNQNPLFVNQTGLKRRIYFFTCYWILPTRSGISHMLTGVIGEDQGGSGVNFASLSGRFSRSWSICTQS